MLTPSRPTEQHRCGEKSPQASVRGLFCRLELLAVTLLSLSFCAQAAESGQVAAFLSPLTAAKPVVLVFTLSDENDLSFRSGNYLTNEFNGRRDEMNSHPCTVLFVSKGMAVYDIYDQEFKDFSCLDLRAAFKVAPDDYAVVLVGKNDQERFRTTEQLSFPDLESAIDLLNSKPAATAVSKP